MTKTTLTSTPQEPEEFERNAREAIEAIRAALGGVLKALATPVRRPVDLARQTGLDKSLAWKIVRCLREDDPFVAARMLPGDAGVQRFLELAADAGVEHAHRAGVEEAMRMYNRLIARHGGDRRTFHRLIEGLAAEDRDRDVAEEQHRRAAFEANSFIYGVKTRVQIALRIVHPSSRGQGVDVAALAGFVDLVRIRSDASWVVARSAYARSDGEIQCVPAREPIEPDDRNGPEGAPLLRAFCSTPVPQLTRQVAPTGFLETILPAGPIGETAAVTLVTGEVLRNVAPRFADKPSETADFITHLGTPAEWFIDLMLVQKDLFDHRPPPEFGVYSEISATIRSRNDCRPQNQVCRQARLQPIGRAGSGIVNWSHHVTRLGELVEFVTERLNWPLIDFDVHQAQVPWPVVGSAAVASFPLRLSDAT